MRAVVALNGRLTCEEVPEPKPKAGQVLVRTLCCGICGTDLHALRHLGRIVAVGRRGRGGRAGGIDPKRGLIFGHEFCAEVLDYGPGSERRFKAGARVVSIPNIEGPSGSGAVGFSSIYPGGYGERMLLSEHLLIEVPNGLSAQQAAMTEPFAVGAHAVAKAALDEPSGALVVGCGPVGLAVIAALKARGYGPVAASDFSPARRAMAERLGADIVIDPAAESPHAKWTEMGVAGSELEQTMARMAGQGVKRAIIFECVGAPGVLQSLIEASPAGSQIIVAGLCMETDQVEPAMAVMKEIDFRFVKAYTQKEFAATLGLIADGRIDVAPIITDVVGLDGVAGAFATLANPESQVKIVVEPDRL